MTRTIGFGCWFALATLVGGLAASAQEVDRVVPIEGRTLSGKITAVSNAGITIDAGGRSVTVEPSNVRRVEFAGEPREVTTARRSLAEGRLNQVLPDLESVDVTRLQPPALAAEVRFMTAYCIAKMAMSGERGTLDEATRGVQEFVATHPDSYRFFEATELLGDLLNSRGLFDQAETQFARLVESPWGDLQQAGRLKLARTQELQEKFDLAAENYRGVEQVESATEASRRAKLSARVGLARCTAFQGDPEAGISTLQEMIRSESSTDVDLFAQIYNALGNCQAAAGRKKEAILAFLHTDLLFYQNADYHAEALYHLGSLFPSVGKGPEGAAALEKLKQRYASSPWASRKPAGS